MMYELGAFLLGGWAGFAFAVWLCARNIQTQIRWDKKVNKLHK
jgi:hypothetical protein